MKRRRSITIVELFVCLAIAGVAFFLFILMADDAGTQSRDAHRKQQAQQLLTSLELYYTDYRKYPDDGIPADIPPHDAISFNDIGLQAQLIGAGKYLPRQLDEPERFRYCTSADRSSIAILLDTENDNGGTGSPYCKVLRGPGPYGCDAWIAVNATDPCSSRFVQR